MVDGTAGFRSDHIGISTVHVLDGFEDTLHCAVVAGAAVGQEVKESAGIRTFDGSLVLEARLNVGEHITVVATNARKSIPR
jgi:hypothetical protein